MITYHSKLFELCTLMLIILGIFLVMISNVLETDENQSMYKILSTKKMFFTSKEVSKINQNTTKQSSILTFFKESVNSTGSESFKSMLNIEDRGQPSMLTTKVYRRSYIRARVIQVSSYIRSLYAPGLILNCANKMADDKRAKIQKDIKL